MYSNIKCEIWKERINNYRSSNLKALEWCNKNNLSVKTLYYWIRKLNKENITAIIPNEFVPITTQNIMLNTTVPIVIRYGKVEIDVSDSCNVANLRKVLEALGVYA